AREALAQSRADAVMIGRGAYGRPWLARAMMDGHDEPAMDARLGIALEHFADSLSFYGDKLGVKIFRKHLGWYVEQAPTPVSAIERREAKSRLCRLIEPREIEAALTSLWRQDMALAA
ncbi:MAG TPA: tRNA-dihydrouridine synthase, partial [Rhizomicrobium sp.]|nr:tRNA-dihydrouridine synthase [Rhizomicrobium sp.]